MRIKWISVGMAAGLFLTVAFLLIFSHRQDLSGNRMITEYNNNWEYSVDGQEGTISLPLRLKASDNTELTVVNTLPSELTDGSGLVFRTRMQSVQVYVEDRLIYQYPEDQLIGREIPSTWNFVRLSDEDAGKQIRICVTSAYSRFAGTMETVRLGPYSDLTAMVTAEQGKVLRMSLVVGIVGLVMLLISFVSRKRKILEWQSSLGLLMMVLSCWLCGESRMTSEYVGVEAWHYMALLSLPLCPVFLTAYLYARWKEVHGDKTKVLFVLSVVVAAGVLLSELLGGPDLVRMLPITQSTVAFTLGYAVWIYLVAAKQKKNQSIYSELACIFVIFFTVFVGIVRFYQGQFFSLYIRMAILLYEVNLLRISVTILIHKVRENQKLERELKRSRAELMTSQIKPHFIYNTLNSIRTLISLDPEMAKKMVYDFTTYLRSNLDNMGEREMISFSEELRHIQAYLDIEKVRFEERLNIVMDVRAKGFQVPPLSIQPLIENAVKHGICKKVDGGTVTLRTYEKSDAYVVQVEDDGAGFDMTLLEEKAQDPREEGHKGLENIRFRVQEIAGGTLGLESAPGRGTKVTVTFRKGKS